MVSGYYLLNISLDNMKMMLGLLGEENSLIHCKSICVIFSLICIEPSQSKKKKKIEKTYLLLLINPIYIKYERWNIRSIQDILTSRRTFLKLADDITTWQKKLSFLKPSDSLHFSLKRTTFLCLLSLPHYTPPLFSTIFKSSLPQSPQLHFSAFHCELLNPIINHW